MCKAAPVRDQRLRSGGSDDAAIDGQPLDLRLSKARSSAAAG